MCTVTFIPTVKGVYLTSNRDEHKNRGMALPPQSYSRNGAELVYPKDPDAGGSWIALKNKKDAAVLLNGAFVKHLHQPPYRKSRGLVFLDILEAHDPHGRFSAIDLSGIEPFTLILFIQASLWQCRWDGAQKHTQLLDAGQPYIWSSATLYDAKMALQREQWFTEWLAAAGDMSTEQVLGFHRNAGNGDTYNGLVMNRDNQLYTVSITSIFIGHDNSLIRYRDLQTATDLQKTFSFTAAATSKEGIVNKLYWAARRAIVRASHWEYWPRPLVYGPLYPYWCWLSIRARSFFFFSAANPGIEYSGFTQERKSDIYDLLPQQYYPATLLCTPGTSGADLEKMLGNKGLAFPLIAKPDIGERGLQVKLLQSMQELEAYSRHSHVDFLIQEYIAYEQEAGIFYYRIPGAAKGHISGIVGKDFMAVTGNGTATILQLLQGSDRAVLQLPALKLAYGHRLHTVLPAGQHCTIVPYGNHSRGARFTDSSDKITDELTETIDSLCRQVTGFYYGRLDIKFNSWEDLCAGKNFSIIELNGAGSEPTHIYDPSHSLPYAWKEICRHWDLLYQISRLNATERGLSLMTIADGLRMHKERSRHLKLIMQL